MNEGLFTGFPVPGSVTRNAYPNNVIPAEEPGGYYGPLIYESGITTVAFGADILMAIPFITQIGGAVSSLAFFNTSAAETGNLARLGIYTDNVGSPNTLVAEASVTTLTAAAALREPTITATLQPNTRYWIANVCNGSVTMRAASGGTTSGSNLFQVMQTSFGNYAFRNGVDPSASNVVLFRTFAYAALPATWGTPTSAASNMPIISWKKT